MKSKLLLISLMCVMSTALWGDPNVVYTDDFSGTGLDPFWMLVDHTDNYAPGGGFAKAADHLRFNSVYTTAYAMIQSAKPVDTTDDIRADAIMRQDHFGASTWGMSVTIYYNAGNWVSLRIASANGQQGLMKDVMLNGVRSSQMTNPAVDLRWVWLIVGVEMTDTQIKFWGSPINPPQNMFGETNIDYWTSEITAFTMARPAGFTGPAWVFIGKGFSGTGAPEPFFKNNQTSEPLPYGSAGFAGIDYARIRYVPFEFLPMDFNEDYRINLEDFAAFTTQWQQCSDPQNPNCDAFWKPQTFEVWEIDPYINFVETQSPPSSDRLSSISVQMAENEYRDTVFMVSNTYDTYDNVAIEVTVEPLDAMPANAVLVQETLYTKNRSHVDTGDGVYPVSGAIVIPAGESRQFRLRFDSRFSGLAAGNYAFNVIIADTFGGGRKVIPGTLEVWDFELPTYDILPNSTWAVFRSVELGISGAGNLIPQAVAEMKQYGLNQVFLGPYTDTPNAAIVDANETITSFDTAQFDEIVSAVKAAWNSTPGTETLQWVLSLSSKIDMPGTQPTLGIQNRTDIQYPSADFNTVYAQYLSLLKARFAYHGFGVEDWMLTFGDEETVSRLEGFTIPIAELTKSMDSTIRLTCNSSYRPSSGWDARYLAAFDVFQPNIRAMIDNPSILAWFKTGGKPIWTYDYLGDMSEVGKNVYSYYRVYGWNLLKYGFSGTGLWTYSSQGGGTNSVWLYETPMYWLAYKHFEDDDVVRSRRYEMYREGSDDYRYVSALRAIAAVKGKTVEAEQLIQDAIDAITADVEDTSRCEYWRLQIAQRILAYQSL